MPLKVEQETAETCWTLALSPGLLSLDSHMSRGHKLSYWATGKSEKLIIHIGHGVNLPKKKYATWNNRIWIVATLYVLESEHLWTVVLRHNITKHITNNTYLSPFFTSNPFFSSPRRPDRLWDPPSPLSNGKRGYFHGGKTAESVAAHSASYSAEVKNDRAIVPLQVVMAYFTFNPPRFEEARIAQSV
jgi:hypothetical protein